MIEVMYQVRKDKFKDNPSIIDDLDRVDDDDQFTHMLTLDEVTTGEDILSKLDFSLGVCLKGGYWQIIQP